MSRHLVFGIGQIGRLVAERLVSLGADVTAVNRDAGSARRAPASREPNPSSAA